MFSIGDLVVHPMHGAGTLTESFGRRIAGAVQDYYVFKMPVGGLLLKIPVANSQAIGIRTVITLPEAESLLTAIPAMDVESSANWNKRYRENMIRLKSGDLYEVARVVKTLMHRDRKRGLSTGERKMLHNARQILISEIVMAEQGEYGDIEARIDRAMLQMPISH